MCRTVLRRQNLAGAQLGRNLVFLKYFHADKLLREMEKQGMAATRINSLVRGALARRLVREGEGGGGWGDECMWVGGFERESVCVCV